MEALLIYWLLLLQVRESAKWDQILDKAVYVSLYANALGKGMNLSVLPTSMGK